MSEISSRTRADAALNRLAKWRTWFTGWQLGTRPISDGPTRAVRDATEARLVLRAEVSTLTALLIDKGVFTADEHLEALAREADFLSESLATRFPGVQATDTGLVMDARAAATMQREGFPR